MVVRELNAAWRAAAEAEAFTRVFWDSSFIAICHKVDREAVLVKVAVPYQMKAKDLRVKFNATGKDGSPATPGSFISKSQEGTIKNVFDQGWCSPALRILDSNHRLLHHKICACRLLFRVVGVHIEGSASRSHAQVTLKPWSHMV